MALNIPLLSNWIIKSNSHNIMLIRLDSNNREEITSYHTSLIDCLQEFLEAQVKGFNARSIEELISLLKGLQRALTEALRPLRMEVKYYG